jgi:hypothetical protein
MTTSAAGTDSRSFVEFYREYAQSWVHTTTAAALTGFIGLASFISPWFLAVAIAVYVLPPIYIYLNDDIDPIPDSEASSAETGSDSDAAPNGDPSRESGPEATSAEHAGETDSPRTDRTDPVVSEREGSERPDVVAASGANGIDDAVRSDTERVGESEPTETDRTEANASAGVGTQTGSGTGTDADIGTERTGADTDADAAPEFETEWVEVDSPADVALRDAVASGDGAYMAGDGGVVLACGEEWEVLLDDGPAGDSNTLWGIDCTVSTGGEGDDEGNDVLWVAGDSGVVGRYDPAAGGIADFSAPKGQTSSWTGLAVTGSAGEETVHLVNGSGAVIRGDYDGAEGAIEWGELDKPGSGSSITAVAFRDREVGYLCDSSGGVYRADDGGASYEAIGPDDAGAAFRDLALIGSEGLLIAGGDGSLFQYDGSAWARRSVSEVPLRAIDTTESDSTDIEGVVGDGAGTIYEYDGNEWTPTETAIGSIPAVVVEDRAFAIGDGGEILERERTRGS